MTSQTHVVMLSLRPTFVEHFISFIQNQHLDGSGPQAPATNHVWTETNVTFLLATRRAPRTQKADPRPHPDLNQLRLLTKHAPGCPCHHMLTIVQFPDVFAHIRPPDAGVTLYIHIVPQSQQHLQTGENQSELARQAM